MITKEERKQLESMARLGNDGRLGTHELLSRILLRVIDHCDQLEKRLEETESWIEREKTIAMEGDEYG